jgi:hypothetical protein
VKLFNAELNPICHVLVLLGAHLILHVSRIRVKALLGAHPILHVTRIKVKGQGVDEVLL